jgi:hypothetical protein
MLEPIETISKTFRLLLLLVLVVVVVVVVVVAIAVILVVVMILNAEASQHNFKIDALFLLFRTVEFVRHSSFIMDLSCLHSIHTGNKETDYLN